jgi:broad specificity phosphatase PhoE
MHIYLLRHGETAWNVAGRYQGRKDSALTARGRGQAAALGRILATVVGSVNVPLRAYVSPLGRAQETAAIVGRHVALDCVDESRLSEVTIGSWDGMSRYEIVTEYPGALDGSDAFDWFFRSPDGESFEAVLRRVSDWLSEVRNSAAVISHGLTGRIVRGVYLGMSRREMLELPVPQEGLYELHAGRMRLIGEMGIPTGSPRVLG